MPLKFKPLIFAWGAGIFFIGYFIFEVPSNLALEKFGASRWIARIMVTWGIGAIALINSIGNHAGFGGPYLIGWVNDATGSTSTGLLVLSLLPLAAGLLVFLGGRDTKTEFAAAK